MATTHSAPIDLYEESREGFAEEHSPKHDDTTNEGRRPDFNGDRDESATELSQLGLERVLGW